MFTGSCILIYNGTLMKIMKIVEGQTEPRRAHTLTAQSSYRQHPPKAKKKNLHKNLHEYKHNKPSWRRVRDTNDIDDRRPEIRQFFSCCGVQPTNGAKLPA